MSTEFRLKPYLTRIGFEGAEAPDLATLKALHAATSRRSRSRASIPCSAVRSNSDDVLRA